MSDANLYVKGFEDLKNELADCRQRVEQKVQDLVRWVRDIDTIESRKGRANIGNELRELSGRPKLRSTEYGIDRREDINDLLEDPQRIVPEARSRYIAGDISRISESAGRLLLRAFDQQHVTSPPKLWQQLETLSPQERRWPGNVWRRAISILREQQAEPDVARQVDGWEDFRQCEAALTAIVVHLALKQRTPKAESSRADPPAQHVFRKVNESWNIVFGDEGASGLKDFVGFRRIARLLESPNPPRPLTSTQLVGRDPRAPTDVRTVQPTNDERSIESQVKEVHRLQAEIEAAQRKGLLMDVQQLTQERARIIAALEKSTSHTFESILAHRNKTGNYRISVRNTLSSRIEYTDYRAVSAALNRAYARLESVKPHKFEKLRAHLKKSIEKSSGSWAYRPEQEIFWELGT